MKVAVGLRRVAAGKRTSGRRAAQIAETFYKNFSDAEKNIFLFDCRKMEEKIENYLSKQKKNVGKGSWNSRGMVNIQKQLRKMRSEMVAIENLGHINEK